MKISNQKNKNLNNFKKLYAYIHPYKNQFYIGIIFLLLSSISSLIFPKLVGELVDGAIISETKIDTIAIWLLILFILQAIFSYLRIVIFVKISEKSLAKLRQDTFNKLIRLPISFFAENKIGELNSRIAADIALLQETFTTTLAEFIRQIIIIIGGIAFLTFISIKLTLFMLATLPVIMIFAVYFGRKIRSYSKNVQKEIAESNNIVEESLQGIRVVKSFTNEYIEQNKYKQKTDHVSRIAIIGGRYRGAFASFIILCVFGAIIAVIWFGTKQVYLNQVNDTVDFGVGDLFSFVIYTVFIGASVGGLADLYSKIQKAIGASEDLLKIHNIETEKIQNTHNKIIKGKIQFKDVSFNYENRKKETVLHNMNFTIEDSENVAIVGPSGSGKSTIISLLLRFHHPTNGSIIIDHNNIKDYNLNNLRSQIGIVDQDIFLFGGTIKENIAYGKSEATMEEIIMSAKQANAHNFINRLENGYNTLVGERGIQLSGGQRQRISIARTILKDPRILILDEATSSLDSDSENKVQQAIKELMKKRTTIIITHRLSSIKHTDKILVIDKGEICQSGNHEKLMLEKDGVYYKLNQLQYLN